MTILRLNKMCTRQGGAVLIMTLMALCLVFMMVHALMQTTGIALFSSATFFDREQALQAAQSGIDYAVTQLQNNPKWRGDANLSYFSGVDDALIVERGGPSQPVYVAESNGNVVGILKTKSGSISAFRLKFNYEDTSEEVYDKARLNWFGTKENAYKTQLPIASPYVCVNNLNEDLVTLVYRANSDGVGIDTKANSVEPALEDGTEFVCHLPAQRVCLIAEGLSGKALRDVKNPQDVTELANSGVGVVRRYVEAWFSGIPPIMSTDAAFANNDVEFDVKQKLLVSSANASQGTEDLSTVPSPGSLRSQKAGVNIKGGVLNTFSREENLGCLMAASPESCSFSLDEEKYVYKNSEGEDEEYQFVKPSLETSQSEVSELRWDEVVQADDTKTNAMQPGFYQWHKAASSTSSDTYYELRYYEDGCKYDSSGCPQPINSANYKLVTAAASEAGSVAEVDGKKIEKMAMAPDGKVAFVTDTKGNITEPSLHLNGNLFCDGDLVLGGAVEEMDKVMPQLTMGNYSYPCEAEGAEGIEAGETEGASEETKIEEGVLTAMGNVYVANSVNGTGSVISKGDVTLVGESLLEAGNSGIGIYSGGDVTLQTLEVAASTTPSGDSISKTYSDTTKAAASTVPTTTATSATFAPGQDVWQEIWDTLGFREKYAKDSSKLVKSWNCVQYAASGSGLSNNVTRNNTCKYTAMSDEDKAAIEEYYADTFGVRIKVRYAYFSGSARSYQRILGYEYLDANGKTISGSKRCYDFWQNGSYFSKEAPLNGTVNSKNCRTVKKHNAPKKAIVETQASQEEVELRSDVGQYISEFGGVSYGDQIITGVIYAHGNFVANLGDKYNLMITGAIKAENGSINVKCKNSSLTYDESNINRVVDSRNWLTRCIWNCW